MLVTCGKGYKRAFSRIKKMQRYIEMGYSQEDAEEALTRHGDDLHAGCHWLMMRESMGRVPKRLKIKKQEVTNTTYIGSIVRYLTRTWHVTDFDAKHALVQLSHSDWQGQQRWEHISDERMEWIHMCHNEPMASVPKASWRRTIGKLKVSLEWVDEEGKRKVTPSNLLNIYIKYGCPSSGGSNRIEEWQKWRAVTALTRQFVHKPNRPKPKEANSNAIHHFRVELMTYFHALCDVYKIPQDTFTDALYNKLPEQTLQLFPGHVHSCLYEKIKRWQLPRPYLVEQNKQWRNDCLPLVDFIPTQSTSEYIVFEVQIHDMTFVRPSDYEPGIHRQLQRIFFALFPYTKPSQIVPGPMDSIFLSNILQASRKTHMPSIEPGSVFVGELFPYQKRCLKWLIERETVCSTSGWGWRRHQMDDGFVFHTSVFGHLSLTSPNNSIRGGLLAQDVGMGKTIEMLALIATQKADGPTLVIVPTTMLSVWQSEAAERTPSLKVLKFHGARRTKNMDDLRAADIVLTTYRIVVSETQQHVPTIGAVRWGRIILDESHELKHVQTATTRAICRLFAPLRWCVSATPFPKAMTHVLSMLSFLGVEPFNETQSLSSEFRLTPAQLLLRNVGEYNPALFCGLLSEMTWWQRKRHVRLQLPTVKTETVTVQNSYPEVYARLLDVIETRMAIDNATVGINTKTRTLHYIRWLRQFAIHPCLNRMSDFGNPSTSSEAPSEVNTIESFIETLGTTNYDQSLRDIIDSWRKGDVKCTICMDAMDRPTLTPCHHLYCYECIQTAYQHQQKCPLCRKPTGGQPLIELMDHDILEETGPTIWRSHDLQGAPVEMSMEMYNTIQTARGGMGNKFKALLDMITKGKEKCIVFTQFHSAWQKTCNLLKEHNIGFVSIEGKMSPNQRDRAIKSFQTLDETRVFVMTTKTASVGITLTAGSHVIFLEPCSSEHLRKQAIGRAWRIGQKNTVTVTTLKTAGTIDCVNSKDIKNHLQPNAVVA
jgi:SWI/SNF-related matrix-associated actin-dependent regulator of chromatin subfamily A3